jgi:hypothetical protein
MSEVYVDEAVWLFRGQYWCHMWSDNTNHLVEFAQKIGLKPHWLQTKNRRFLHFDLSPAKRALAIKNGAIEVNAVELLKLVSQHHASKKE